MALEVSKPRDPLLQPFAVDSIWNTPIGADAVYVHAQLEGGQGAGMTVDEDLIVLRADAPLTPIRVSTAGWDPGRNRCVPDGDVLFEAPMPEDWVVGPQNWDGSTPNSGMAVLMRDGRTVMQTQPFARCEAGGVATSQYVFETVDLYGPGMGGAHGGSGLSSIGGAIRMHELRPDSEPIRHALKVNVFGPRNLRYDEVTRGFRWPASRADSYAPDNYGKQRQGPIVPECRMGALLALPPSIDLAKLGLKTEPARRIARAMQDYGAYIVDDTGWDVFAIVTEWGPDGRVTEQFERDWGFSFVTFDRETAWAKDMQLIFENLHVVDNNGPESVGGGGKPRVPVAAPLREPTE